MLNFACKTFDMQDIIRCSLGLSKSECRLLNFLLGEHEALTTSEIAKRLDIDRTTVQKSIKALVEKDVVKRLQENLDKGGYIFRYIIKDKDIIRNKIKRNVSFWYENVMAGLEKW
ncbi:MAG: helix-turn-helix domain-containing protein [Candidatus Woesearchaeota archaeon]